MPNHVFTRLTIDGEPSALRAFAEKAAKPYKTFYPGVRKCDESGKFLSYDADAINESEHDSEFSFWNFLAPEDTEAYFSNSDNHRPAEYDSWTFEQKFAFDMRFTGNGWYDWNVRNWGTKWDAYDVEVDQTDIDTGTLVYRFTTAWSPAEGAFRAIVSQHPELSFYFYCIEEQGWGVTYEGDADGLAIASEWDVPESHREWEGVDEECRACMFFDETEEGLDQLYSDCPPAVAARAKSESVSS